MIGLGNLSHLDLRDIVDQRSRHNKCWKGAELPCSRSSTCQHVDLHQYPQPRFVRVWGDNDTIPLDRAFQSHTRSPSQSSKKNDAGLGGGGPLVWCFASRLRLGNLIGEPQLLTAVATYLLL